VDLATVHLCHAGVVAATGRLTSLDGSLPRRLNTGLTRALSILAERWTYRVPRARALAVVSPELRREVLAHYPVVPVFLTPNGVDLERFAPDTRVRSRVRGQWNVPEDEFVALFVGGDWARKGLRTAIEALAVAGRDGVTVRLWVVGAGDEPRYRTHARRVGVDDRLVFFGPRTDAETFYRTADVLVLPSRYETFSLVAHEAAASALPVVITPVSGVVDLVGHDDAGILVDPTPDSVGAALVRLAREPTLRRRMGDQGRWKVAGRTWEASVDNVIELYGKLSGPREAVRNRPGQAVAEVGT
jgi:UDP-glucose:(heptosyl)LPS alpha-1,3-glucosyltransferase